MLKVTRISLAAVAISAGFSLALTVSASAHVRLPVVFALGDSITSGGALPNTADAWPDQATVMANGQWTVVNDGINSDTMANAAGEWIVNGELPMQMRLRPALKHRPVAVVLLGGTNDIGHVTVRAEEKAISRIAQRVNSSGAEFIVSTIPPVGLERPDLVADNPQRNAINEWIRKHFHGAHLIDFYQYLAVDGLLPDSEQVRADGVHPSTAAETWFAQQALQDLNTLNG